MRILQPTWNVPSHGMGFAIYYSQTRRIEDNKCWWRFGPSGATIEGAKNTNLDNIRAKCLWEMDKKAMVNRNIAMRDRFRYFNAVVTPVACFGAAQKKGVQTRFVQDGYFVSPVASMHSG